MQKGLPSFFALKTGYFCAAITALTLPLSAATAIGTLTPDAFAARFDQLNAAYDRPAVDAKPALKAEERTALLAKADAVCDGKAFFYREEAIPIGLDHIDWTGGQKPHQEWVAQLNRFAMLEFLIGAYRETRDEKYAARAKTLMQDWFDYRAKQGPKFIDPQRNSPFNAALRLRTWMLALAVFRHSAAFDDAFVKRALEVISGQCNLLARYTAAGPGNHATAQAFTLLEAGIVFDFLPDSAEWRNKGQQVLAECFKQQFRADGSHCENTTGYHTWMTAMMIDALALAKLRPDLPSMAAPETIARALQFTRLSSGFAFNDSSYPRNFPHRAAAPNLTAFARRAGVEFRPLTYGVFPDAGLVFGGDGNEVFAFDAGKFCGWHTHLSRLGIEFGAGGYSLIIDPAITTYEKKDPHFDYGRITRSHGTVNFNGANQTKTDAQLLDARLGEGFGVAVGQFDGGAATGPLRDKFEADIAASHRRAVLYLAGEGLLIFDRTRIDRTPDGKGVTNYVFPLAPMAKWTLDAERPAWYSANSDRPNLLVQMLLKPVPNVKIDCVEGAKEPELRGWVGTARDAMISAPTLQFSADTGFAAGTAVTFAAAFAPGAAVPLCDVAAVPGGLDFTPASSEVVMLRFAPDFATVARLSAGTVKAEAAMLWLKGKRIFVYRARQVSVNGKPLKLVSPDFTGWID
ncbi:MAG: heparinase II/III family protein [Victivallaceae bacterium]